MAGTGFSAAAAAESIRPISEGRPGSSGRVVVTSERLPSAAVADALWQDYEATFRPLQERALLNHLYERAEFDELLFDPRVVKLIGWKHGVPIGLAMVTNALDIVPQISPRFLERQFPTQARDRTVFFAILMFVTPTARARTLFARLAGGAAQIAAEHQGVIVFDVCQYNVDEMSLARQFESMSTWFPNCALRQIDAQYYFAATFTAPIDTHKFVPGVEDSVLVVHQREQPPSDAEVGVRRLPRSAEPSVLVPGDFVASNSEGR